jgi:FkbM family methyltransferase
VKLSDIARLFGRKPRLLAHHRPLVPRSECEYHGNRGYGGWMVQRGTLTADSIVYSFGVGQDVSFDLSLIARYGLQVFAFDPTPRSVAWVQTQKLPERFHFFSHGIAAEDGTARFYPPDKSTHVSYSMVQKGPPAGEVVEAPVFRLETITRTLGHKRLDLVKLDVEGTEYAVIDDLLHTPGIEIGQLLIEFHHRFKHLNVAATDAAITKLSARGYALFYMSDSEMDCCFIRR